MKNVLKSVPLFAAALAAIFFTVMALVLPTPALAAGAQLTAGDKTFLLDGEPLCGEKPPSCTIRASPSHTGTTA